MYNFLCAAHVADKYGLKLVVLFDDGPYLETQPRHLERYAYLIAHCAKNWFHYYYEGLEETRCAVIKQYIEEDSAGFKRSVRPLVHKNHVPVVEYGKGLVYEWTRQSFHTRDAAIDYNKYWHKYVQLRPHIQNKMDRFVEQHMTGCRVIGIHFRGTDKYAAPGDSEDNPVHYEYSFCENMVRQHIKTMPGHEPVKILVCSDEQAFIEYMKSKFPTHMLLYTDSIRSTVCTDGVDIDSASCGPMDSRPECKLYRSLRYQSVHLGMKDQSSYQKGEDVLLDVLLLSKCKVFLKSRGNVSNFPKYISKELIVVDLVDEYTRYKALI
jgi:hypothetical protein